MREIKFRVPHYNSTSGKFDHFSYWGRGINRSEFCSPERTNFTEPGEDEQFIGLKDKNGVDIYEGDILATSNNDPEYDIWDKEDFGFSTVEWNNDLSSFVGLIWNWQVGNINDTVYDLKFVEVIGNIHQGVIK